MQSPVTHHPGRYRTPVRAVTATVLLVLSGLFTVLAALMFEANFLLMMPFAITALVMAFVARRFFGAPRLVVYPLMLFSLIPMAVAGYILVLLLLNNPVKFHLNGLSIVDT